MPVQTVEQLLECDFFVSRIKKMLMLCHAINTVFYHISEDIQVHGPPPHNRKAPQIHHMIL